jgi:hypothetical protein
MPNFVLLSQFGVDPVRTEFHSSRTIAKNLKEHGASCVFLIINDNLYGLVFALSYI